MNPTANPTANPPQPPRRSSSISASLSTHCCSTQALLRAVFTNLIGNGLKFCAGRVDGRIEVRGRNDGGTVTIEVADNGVGFDNAEAGTLFKPFQHLHGAQFDGNGVGLSIVRRAVERHGGQVWAESL